MSRGIPTCNYLVCSVPIGLLRLTVGASSCASATCVTHGPFGRVCGPSICSLRNSAKKAHTKGHLSQNDLHVDSVSQEVVYDEVRSR